MRSREKGDFLEGLRKVAAHQSVFPYSLGNKLDGSRCHTFSESLLSTSFLVKGGNTKFPSHAPVHLGKNWCGKEMISNMSKAQVPFRPLSLHWFLLFQWNTTGHTDYYTKEGAMSPKYCTFVIESILLHKQQHIGQTYRNRREQWELLHHCRRTLCPGREAQPQHMGLFNIIPSCGETAISC